MTRFQRIILKHQIDWRVRQRLTASGKARFDDNLPEGSGQIWPPVIEYTFTHERHVYPSLDFYDGV